MKNWNLLTWILFIVGEALVIAGFCLFGRGLPDNIYYLDLTVSTVVYILLFLNFGRPMVSLSDESGKDVGSLGINWTFSTAYALLAVACMIALPYWELGFKYQFIAQAVLLFFLIMGMVFGRESADKVGEVYRRQQAMTGGLDAVRRQMRRLNDTLAVSRDISPDVRGRLDRIGESLRYLAPSDNPEAAELEEDMAAAIADIDRALPDAALNRDLIDRRLTALERYCENRRNIYSR